MESIRLESIVFDATTVHTLHSIITRNVIPSIHGIVVFTFHTVYHSYIALFYRTVTLFILKLITVLPFKSNEIPDTIGISIKRNT